MNNAETEKKSSLQKSLEEAIEAEYQIAGINPNAFWREAVRNRKIYHQVVRTDGPHISPIVLQSIEANETSS